MITIESIFSSYGYGRKTHLEIDGEGCHIAKSRPDLLWDNGGQIDQRQYRLLLNGDMPADTVCKWCLRRAKRHLATASTPTNGARCEFEDDQI